MRNQKGAALIVVLSLLTISLMVGLSSMQSSQIDERLAGNYKAQSVAQMGAEEAASEGFQAAVESGKASFSGTSLGLDDLKSISWEDFENDGDDNGFGGQASVAAGCENVSCYYRNVLVGSEYYIVAMGGVDDGAVSVSEPVVVEVEVEAGGGIISGVDAALTCIKSRDDGGCSFIPGSGKSGPSVDGTDRFEKGKITGSHKPEPNPDGNDVASILMPDGGSVSSRPGDDKKDKKDKKDDKDAMVGEQIYSPEDYNEYAGRISDTWDESKERISKDIANALEIAKSGNIPDNFFYAGPGDTVTPNSSSGVVVLEGGILDLGGSDKFSGLVLMITGIDDYGVKIESSIQSGGTSTIVGAVVGEDFGYGGSGNPSIFYSSEAIKDFVGWDGVEGSGGTSDKFKITTWK
ncbi:hypothetical protein FEI13_11545 [Halomonas urmiana]|uniref:Type 4 fimbrial biogenesis protein PilX N-terminal domain-containing protein n=1 Tax=Halomonas urmiana TaxID=490901 RepID=A0A5R8MIC4_9GAMM|nr:PilX N-terminal domain-containing pilus assembly protein [Halomonas urmiana]TLF49574.1 hypothetical protein FEI13_11545 [Halomonas urmiana]